MAIQSEWSESFPEKRILVTGGSGFLGRYLLGQLAAEGARQVFAPRSAEYDLRDEKAVERVFADLRPEVVIHLAAVVGGIGANRARPGTFFYDNVLMGVHLFEHARRNDVQKFVAVGTVCAYPKFTPVPFREDDLWSGYPEETNAPYGLAKKMLLVQAQAYRQQYGLNSIFLLPCNLYGPGDNFDPQTSHVIPAIIRKCIEAKETGQNELVLWGDGSPTREFLYVEEAARAIVLATRLYDGAEPVNIGTGSETSIRQIAAQIASLTGYEGKIVWDSRMPGGQPRRCLDVSRARKYFGFESSYPLREGIEKTVEWYLARRNCPPERPLA
ncbi:GDP-L-fucose synthase [bacterium]|nr:GDP-L-fucose synthase [bacterium]